MDQDIDHFVWVPAYKPRRRRAQLAAALIGVACAGPFGSVRLPDRFEVIDRRGSEGRNPGLTDRIDVDPLRVGVRETRRPTLAFRYEGKAVGPADQYTAVRRLQSKLSVDENGALDPSTQKALRSWQRQNGLAADGIAGPATLMIMGLYDRVRLKRGAHGEAVKTLQQHLAIGADGRFGWRTEQAVRDYQKQKGLAADGIVGSATLARLFKGPTVDRAKGTPS